MVQNASPQLLVVFMSPVAFHWSEVSPQVAQNVDLIPGAAEAAGGMGLGRDYGDSSSHLRAGLRRC